MKPKFDGYAAQYDAWFMENDNLFQSELRLFKRALGDISGQRVLSVGCGSGLFESMIRSQRHRGHRAFPRYGRDRPEARCERHHLRRYRGCRPGRKCLRCDFTSTAAPAIWRICTRLSLVCKKALKPGGRFISLDVPKESAFGFMYLLAKNLGTFDHPYLNGVMPQLPYPLELCSAGVWHSTEEKINVLKDLGFHDFDYCQTLLKNPMYTNEDVEDAVPGYQSGGYVAIIARK